MEIDDIEIGCKYRCEYRGKRYFASVISKSDTDVLVTLGDAVNEDDDPGDPIDALGTVGKTRVAPDQLHPR